MTIRVITNVDKSDDRLEAISNLVGPDWGPLSLAEAVAWAKSPGNQFVVKGAISALDVMVVSPKSGSGPQYLQTRIDPENKDNLLTLPAIPSMSNILVGRPF